MTKYTKPSDKHSRTYDIEKKVDGPFEITISVNGKEHNVRVFLGGNNGIGFNNLPTRTEAKMWADDFLEKMKIEYKEVIEASEKFNDGLHWIKNSGGKKYELVEFRKYCGIIQVFHMGWDCSSSLIDFDISSIQKAVIIDPDANIYETCG